MLYSRLLSSLTVIFSANQCILNLVSEGIACPLLLKLPTDKWNRNRVSKEEVILTLLPRNPDKIMLLEFLPARAKVLIIGHA